MKRILPRFVCLLLLAACLFHAASHVCILNLHSTAAPLRPADEAARARVDESYGKLPLGFEANHGQADPEVKYLSRGANYNFAFAPAGATLHLREAVVRMKFTGSNPNARIEGEEELPGKSNYLVGADRSKWRTNIPNYARVRYDEVWPGIDLVFYGGFSKEGRQLEYDFVVARGADPRAIKLSFEGAKKLSVESLFFKSTDGGANWNLVARNLVVAPDDFSLTFDPAGAALYVTSFRGGLIKSTDGGATWRPVGPPNKGIDVIAIDPANPLTIYAGTTELRDGDGVQSGLYKTVDGGANWAPLGDRFDRFRSLALAVNPQNPAVVYAGTSGYSEAFALKLNPAGDSLVYAKYLGEGAGAGIAVDATGAAYVTGSGSVPRVIRNGIPLIARSGFMMKLDARGEVAYSTFLPAPGQAIAVDEAGKAYVTGTVSSNSPLPVKGGFQTSNGGGGSDAFALKIDPEQSGEASLLYSTYLGGSREEVGRAIVVDARGQAYVAGETLSDDFTFTPSTLRSTKADIFFVHPEIFDHFSRFVRGQVAFTKVAMDDGLEFNTRQFAGGDARRGVCQLPDSRGAGFIEITFGDVGGIEVWHDQSRISEM